MKNKILIVEDDASIRETLRDRFLHLEYEVDTVSDGLTAIKQLESETYILVICDLRLPGADGTEVVTKIPDRTKTGVIAMTAEYDDYDVADMLHLGFEDYIKKPFDSRELEARVESLISRIKSANEEEEIPRKITVNNVEVNQDLCTFSINGEKIDLTSHELKFMQLLMNHPERYFSREELLIKVWGWQYGVDTTRTVDSHVKNIRLKIGDRDRDNDKKIILTKSGSGYAFNSKFQ
jgi:DNA-binding response OmpR family regulator